MSNQTAQAEILAIAKLVAETWPDLCAMSQEESVPAEILARLCVLSESLQ